MPLKNFIQAIPLTAINSAALTGAYQLINTGGTLVPLVLLRIVNGSDQDVLISYNGSTDNDVVQKGTTLQVPAQQNAQPTTNVLLFSKGTKVYAKGTAGTGFIYVIGYFQQTP